MSPNAINPLDIVPELFWPEVSDLLIASKYIGQKREYYLRESDKYIDYLSKGGKPFKAFWSNRVNTKSSRNLLTPWHVYSE